MEESIDNGTSVIDCTSCTAWARIAGSSASGMPALTSSIWAPAATCARVSASTRLKLPAAISAARILRPVGLMRSPIMTNGRSRPSTTSRVCELITVSVMLGGHPVGIRLRIPSRVPRHAAAEHAGTVDDLCHGFLLAVGHQVHAVHAPDGADFLDQLDAHIAPLAHRVAGAGEPLDQRIGNMHARNVRADPLGRLG